MQERITFIEKKTEEVFLKYGIRTYVDSRTPLGKPIRGAKYITYGLVLENPTQLKKVEELTEVLAYACRCGNVIANREGGVLWLQYELEEKYWINYLFDGGGVGVASGNKIITYDFVDSAPHSLVAGSTGSGKSELVKTILAYLMLKHTPEDLRIGICDPHSDFTEFDGCSHLIGSVQYSEEGISKLLDSFDTELKERVKLNHRKGIRLLLVLDEAQSGLILGDKASGFNAKNIGIVKDIARQARKYRMHLLVSTQKPTHTDLPGLFDMLNYRFVGKTADAGVSAKLTGQAGVETHKLLGRGDFVKINGGVTRFQAAYLKDFTPSRQYLPLPFLDNSVIITSEIVPEVLAEYLREEITEKDAQKRFGLPSGIHVKYLEFSKRILLCVK